MTVALLLAVPAPAQERPEAAPATSLAQLEIDGRREPLPMANGPYGPLFLLKPILVRLGVDHLLVPVDRSHRVTAGGIDVVLGPNAYAMTVGREIVNLRQAPIWTPAGLLAPLEALERIGELHGVDLAWSPTTGVLEVRSRRAREVGLDLQVVHIQGVTTVVLQFDHPPRYEVATLGSVVEIASRSDRFRVVREPRPPRHSLLDRIEIDDTRVRLHLAAGAAAAEPYVLAAAPGQASGRGLRLVIDISRSAAPRQADLAPPAALDPKPARDRPGLRTIVLDPGHGGSEQGAIGPAGTEEKELTLILAKALKRKLEERLAVHVVLTRSEDADLPLDTRTALANQIQGDLFISIHLNASPATSAHGAETYFLAIQPSDERARLAAEAENRSAQAAGRATSSGEEGLQLLLWDLAQSQHLAASQRLATLIQDELNRALGLPDRGVRQAPFAVLMGATMPAVLLELGFISNPAEEARLLDPAYRADLLDAVARAVVRFKSILDSGPERASVGRE
ncbi:MAG TPA: N-acetylmuramoyl-L-alanine amidase [Thermoanaerobaculia bacterium]|nr:N-acetylmuramoyl-L-alanine amidase [Thermoanaerobaculia bacterium]